MSTTRSYYVSLNTNRVRRLDNLTLPWRSALSFPVGITPNPSDLPIGYYGNDIMTDPTNPDKVFVAGNNSGIFVSSNAGVNWVVPTGNYNVIQGLTWHEVWCVDTNIIYICGTGGRVVKSIDGGLSFNLTATLPTPTSTIVNTGVAQAIHFINPLVGVVGYNDTSVHNLIVYKTFDGGATWGCLNNCTTLLPNFITGVGHVSPILINAIKLKDDPNPLLQEVTVNTEYGIYHSNGNNGAIAIPLVYTWAQTPLNPVTTLGYGLHMTWFDNMHLWAIGGYNHRAKSIDGGLTWTQLSFNSSSLNPRGLAEHFYKLGPDSGFYSSNNFLLSTTNSGSTSDGLLDDSINQVENLVTAVWTQVAEQKCYLFRACDGFGIVAIATGYNFDPYIGSIISITELYSCVTVEEAPSCDHQGLPFSDFTGIDVGPAITVNTREECCDPFCYILHDCSGVNPDILTTTDMTGFVGTVVNNVVPSPDPDLCYQVQNGIPCGNGIEITFNHNNYTGTDIEDACSCCLPKPPIPPTPPPAKVRPLPVKYFYQIKESLCDIDATKKFANGYWKLAKSLKYGINSCCTGIDLEQLWLKYQLSQLSMILDPLYCNKKVTTCSCSCSPCAQLNPCNSCNNIISQCGSCHTCNQCNSQVPCPAPVQDEIICPYPDPVPCTSPIISPSTLPNPIAGVFYAQFIISTGTSSPFIYTISAGALPPGVILDQNTGEIFGIPTALGPYSFTILVTDHAGCTATQDYTFTVECDILVLYPITLLSPVQAPIPYLETITTSGGIGPYTYSIPFGVLPPNLSLGALTGIISGNLTIADIGIYAFIITSTDSLGCIGSRLYNLEVTALCIAAPTFNLLSGVTYVPFGPLVYTPGPVTGQCTHFPTSGTLFSITGTGFFDGLIVSINGNIIASSDYVVSAGGTLITFIPAITQPILSLCGPNEITISNNCGTAQYCFRTDGVSNPCI